MPYRQKPKSGHQLAVILFSDIAGYTQLMGKDSAKALALVKRSKEIQKPLVEQHHGQWLKEMGDGMMARFESAIDAVRCAIEIQKMARTSFDGKLHIGIHLGDVKEVDGEIYGDGVNVASRLENIAEAGGIYISESVEKAIRGQVDIETKFLGELSLKNVDYGVRTYAIQGTGLPEPAKKTHMGYEVGIKHKSILISIAIVVGLGILYFIIYRTSESPAAKALKAMQSSSVDKSIAVLPFTDMSPDGDQEYFGDGIAEEVINGLTKIEGIRVIGRTSSFSYKGQTKDLRSIGQELNVATILEGSIRKSQNKIRVTAQLIDTRDGSHLWSETFDRELEDIFALQDEISKIIANKFEITISLATNSSPPTKSIEAYEYYLKGNRSLELGVPGIMEAIKWYEKAIQIDPEFFDAVANHSYSCWSAGIYDLGDRDELNNKARTSALKAIEIEPDDPRGYIELANLLFYIDWDWENALKNVNKVTDMDIRGGKTSYVYASLYGWDQSIADGLLDELSDDPRNIQLLLDISRMYLGRGQFENVIENAEKILELSPQNMSIRRHLGLAQLFLENYDQAEIYFSYMMERDSTYAPYGMIGLLHQTGRTQEARVLYSQIEKDLATINKAFSFVFMEELDSAFKYLDVAFQEKSQFLPFIKMDQNFYPLREDPRYDDMLAKMGLDQYGD